MDEFYVVPDPLPEGEPGDLIRAIAGRRAGEKVNLLVSRAGRQTVVGVNLGLMPENAASESSDE